MHTIGVERLGRICVADLANGFARDLIELHVRFARDLTREDQLVAFREDFARDATAAIRREMRVEDRVGDVVAHLVRMTFAHGLRCEHIGQIRRFRVLAAASCGCSGCCHDVSAPTLEIVIQTKTARSRRHGPLKR